MSLEAIVALAFGSPAVLGLLVWGSRKMFVSWTRDNVTVVGHDATVAVMSGLKDEVERLSKNNKELADENRQLQKQINRLEAILSKIAAKFGIDMEELLEEHK